MAANSKIEWTDHTFNPWRGCSKVSPGCDHCYADTMSKRNPGLLGIWGPESAGGTRIVASEEMWRQPLKWNAEAEKLGIRKRVFCASLADVFEDWKGPMLYNAGGHEPIYLGMDFRASSNPANRLTMNTCRFWLYRLIYDTPHLDWLLLTKRPENLRDLWHIPNAVANGFPWKHVAIGVTVENQEQVRRLNYLAETPAAVKFVSAEPLLGPLILQGRCDGLSYNFLDPTHPRAVHWVIAGGESGPNARPCHPDWIRSLRDQCTAAGVPFFFKQWGEFAPSPDGGLPDRLPDSAGFYFGEPHAPHKVWKFGKKKAGRTLDGVEWSQFPTPCLRASVVKK